MSIRLFVLSSYLLLGGGLVGAAILETRDTVVRRESVTTVHLGPSGEASTFHAKKAAALLHEQEPDITCEDFTLGEYNESLCWGTGEIFTDTALCRAAAAEAEATTTWSEANTNNNFVIDTESQFQHPKGCFMYPCSEGASTANVCYWVNMRTVNVDHPTPGRPVCQRPKYQNSTECVETEGHWVEGECPDNYTEIYNESQCKTAATCMSEAPSVEEFVISGEELARYDDFPAGCFIKTHAGRSAISQPDEADGKVYYNPPLYNSDGTVLKPANPRGTKLCKVAKPVKFVSEPKTWPGLSHPPAAL